MSGPGLQPMGRIADSVLGLAAYVARATGAKKVDGEHLLVALAEHPLAGARRVLRRVVDVDALPAAEERAVALDAVWNEWVAPRMRRSRHVQAVVRNAWVNSSPPVMTSVDLLVQLAASRTDAGAALRAAGVSQERLGGAIAALRRDPLSGEPWAREGPPIDGVPSQADIEVAIGTGSELVADRRLASAKRHFEALAASRLIEDDEVRLLVRAWRVGVEVMHDGPIGGADLADCRRAIEARSAMRPSKTLHRAAVLVDAADLNAAESSGDIAATRTVIRRLRSTEPAVFQELVDQCGATVEHNAGTADVEVDRLLLRSSALARAGILADRGDEAGAAEAIHQARRDADQDERRCRRIEAQLSATAADRRGDVLDDLDGIDDETAAGTASISHLVAAVNARLLGIDDAERHACDCIEIARRHGLGGHEGAGQLELARALLRRGDRAGAIAAAEAGLVVAQRLGQGRTARDLEALLGESGTVTPS